MTHAWFEVWADESADGEAQLVVRPVVDGGFEIVDPREPKTVVGTFGTYEEAVEFMAEDEYVKLGRVERAVAPAAE